MTATTTGIDINKLKKAADDFLRFLPKAGQQAAPTEENEEIIEPKKDSKKTSKKSS